MKWSITLLSILCVALIFERSLYAQDVKGKVVDIYFSSEHPSDDNIVDPIDEIIQEIDDDLWEL
ncbi:MAG: hypothetical protein QNK40_07000 [Desulfobacterales bacterium]|nr:hypothetical protein [Desulfobacterales bacterium]